MQPRSRVGRALLVLIVLLVPAILAMPGESLPLFARKYNMQCTACHFAFPKLNSFGMKFRQNGYRLQGQPGTSPWEDKTFPLSLVGDVGYHFVSTLNPADETGTRVRTNTSSFQQNAVELHTAGTLSEHITFHFDNNFAGVDSTLLSGMAFLQLDELAGGGALNVKAGIYDAEIPYLSASRRLTHHDYLFPATLDGRGIELNGTTSGWTYAAALINSARTHGKPDAKTMNNFENVYAWIMRDLGTHAVTARILLDNEDPRVADANSSKHVQVDVSGLVNLSRAMVVPAVCFESHSDVNAGSADVPEKVTTAMLEASVLLDEARTWVLTGRYELQHATAGSFGTELDHSLATINLSYFLNPNAKIGLDWARENFNRADQARTDELQAYIHVGY